MLSHNTEKGRFCFHPVERFDEGVVSDALHEFKDVGRDVKDAYF